jgi:hypothetical protein
MKNKNHTWKTRTGLEHTLGEMETSHLLNTVMFLTKRQKEYDTTFEAAVASGLVIPELEINGELCSTWIERMSQELDRRRRKEVAKAKKIMEYNKLL